MKAILYDIAAKLEGLATSTDAIEELLISKGILARGEVDALTSLRNQAVLNHLAELRSAIASLDD